MMVDTAVYGWYIPDVGPICAMCADLDRWSRGLENLLGENGPQPLYSIDDTDSEGLACDAASDPDCTGWVFEPVCAECYSPGEPNRPLEVDDENEDYTYIHEDCRKGREDDA